MIGQMDTLMTAEAIGYKEEAKAIALKILDFGNTPSEDEVLARCRMAFDYILYHAMESIQADCSKYEVTVESVEE